MFNNCIVLVIFECVLSKSFGNAANIPRPGSSSRLHVLPNQNFQTNHMMKQMTDSTGLHVSRPGSLYNPKTLYGHNMKINPVYVSVLNNPNIKTKYNFIFSSPHHVQFHNKNGDNMKFNAHIYIESLKGNFKDFIEKDGEFHQPDDTQSQPEILEESSGQFNQIKKSGNIIKGDQGDASEGVTEATAATPGMQVTTMISLSVTDGNYGQEEMLYDIDIRKDPE